MFKLTDNFVNFYKTIKPDWGFKSGPNSIGELTYARTYSRIKEDGTNETWADTVRRVVEGTYEIQRRHAANNNRDWDDETAVRSAQEMYDRIFNFKFLPPGRGLWMAGTDYVMERNNGAPMNNCFGGETEIITREYGPVRLDSLVDETVTVNSRSGWSKAEVNSFGVQDTQRVTLAPAHPGGRRMRSNIVLDVVATPDHRWILENGSETTNLSVGDVVPSNPVVMYNSDEYEKGVRHGLVFGDGTRNHFVGKDGLGRFHIRLCGEKAQSYVYLFHNVTRPESANGDPVAHIKSFDDLKSFPEGKSPGYLRGFVEGWMVADASINPSGSYVLASQRTDSFDWLMNNAATAGYVVVGHSLDTRDTNFGERKNPLNKITLVESAQFKVVSITPLDEQEVFCATVPDEGNFTLANGLLTGNCAFISTEELLDGSSYPFTFLMDMSMLGVGVGFDTDGVGARVYWPNANGDEIFVVPDSREGWVESVGLLIDSHLNPGRKYVTFDYSEVRPAGEPIKGFGGTASGPAPLKKLHERIRSVMSVRGLSGGGTLTSRDIVDIQNMIGACVVAGNVRRSAELALGEWSDEDFVNLKNYELNPERGEWGWASNNTVVVREGDEPDYEAIAERISDNGEPGLFYLDVARKYGRLGDEADFKDMRVKGTNPCVTAGTWVQTVDGPRQVRDLVGNRVNVVVDGREYKTVSEGFWHTGTKEVFLLSTFEGYSAEMTFDHKVLTDNRGWVEAGDLVDGDQIVVNKHTNSTWSGKGTEQHGYLAGLLVGDGYINNGKARLLTWGDSDGIQPAAESAMRDSFAMRKDFTGWSGPYGNGWWSMMTSEFTRFCDSLGLIDSKSVNERVEQTSSDFYIGFLRGLFDADGHVEGHDNNKGISVRLTTVSADNAYATQRMLARLGILSKVYHSERSDGYGSERTEYRVCITSGSAREFYRLIGFEHKEKQSRLSNYFAKNSNYDKKFVARFASLEFVGVEDVYDITVDDVHAFDANGLYVHNCAEQMLESGELCTLVEVFPTRCTDIVDFLRTLKFAYLYAKTVTLIETHDERTNEVMRRNRRIGTSNSGAVQFVNREGKDVFKQWLRAGYGYIDNLDRKYSKWLGVPESVRKTTVKPSGTVSLLAGATPGVHYPVADYYIRRIRLSDGHPLVDKLVDAGYHVEPDQYSDNTMVVEMPVKGEGLPTETEVSIFDKADLATFMAEHWSDNAVSCTITFQPNERECIETVLRNNEGKWKTVSFMPLMKTTFPQMPYEEISPERYEEMVKDLKPMDMVSGTDGEMEEFCTTDVCEIKYVGAKMEIVTEDDLVDA